MTSRAAHVKSDINITPLIDIVLVLLIVFIVMVPCLSKALKVAVPSVVRTDPPKGDTPPVVLTLEGSGKLYLQREEIELAALCDRLVPVVLLQPLGYRKLFLKVDGELTHARAVRVLDQIQVASERARKATKARPGYGEEDGGDIKVAITLLKGPRPV